MVQEISGRLHDLLVELYWPEKQEITQEEVHEVFEKLPQSIKLDIDHWGISDTVVGDNIFEWLKGNWNK